MQEPTPDTVAMALQSRTVRQMVAAWPSTIGTKAEQLLPGTDPTVMLWQEWSRQSGVPAEIVEIEGRKLLQQGICRIDGTIVREAQIVLRAHTLRDLQG